MRNLKYNMYVTTYIFKFIAKHIIVKEKETKNKEETLKALQRKDGLPLKKPVRVTATFLTETMETSNDVVSVLNAKRNFNL